MACMRWESVKTNHQHQYLPWTAASAICSHRQLHKLVQPSCLLTYHLSIPSSPHRSLSCSSVSVQSAVQHLQLPSRACKVAGSDSYSRSSISRRSCLYNSSVLSSAVTQTTVPGNGWPPSSSPGGGDNGDDPYNANFGGRHCSGDAEVAASLQQYC